MKLRLLTPLVCLLMAACATTPAQTEVEAPPIKGVEGIEIYVARPMTWEFAPAPVAHEAASLKFVEVLVKDSPRVDAKSRFRELDSDQPAEMFADFAKHKPEAKPEPETPGMAKSNCAAPFDEVAYIDLVMHELSKDGRKMTGKVVITQLSTERVLFEESVQFEFEGAATQDDLVDFCAGYAQLLRKRLIAARKQ